MSQPDPARGADPAPDPPKPKTKLRQEAPPVALALDLAFGATIWAQVAVSTAGPIIDLSRMVREGYYKLEIIQLVLISAQAGRPLKEVLEKRKKGAKLARLAADYKLDYDKLYESALAIEELVDKEYLPRFPERKLKRDRDDQP